VALAKVTRCFSDEMEDFMSDQCETLRLRRAHHSAPFFSAATKLTTPAPPSSQQRKVDYCTSGRYERGSFSVLSKRERCMPLPFATRTRSTSRTLRIHTMILPIIPSSADRLSRGRGKVYRCFSDEMEHLTSNQCEALSSRHRPWRAI
jgi:hypothetical protein